jgi:hypothetical protein
MRNKLVISFTVILMCSKFIQLVMDNVKSKAYAAMGLLVGMIFKFMF